ncbi:alpha/beta-hydrolase [Hypomontagnella monticulosa]|nr:alpha/beta-hydrolase [Hypomontagnella monticulosa]
MFLKSILIVVTLLLRPCLNQNPPAPVVDLGYARYQGYYNSTSDLNIYKGIRYAAPPVGKLRWQLPQIPTENRSQVIPAVEYAPQCPQSGFTPNPRRAVPSGSEDCLFVNVLGPPNKTMLPVLVWIHGGGYGLLNGAVDPSPVMHTNGNSFIIVTIQYRLGAFGFLSSAELARSGVPNAGIHDQFFALQWVQKHIHHFGGDPTQVTIAGNSAGGGSAMLLGMAYGGAYNNSLFNGIIASSPYLPTQWDYDGIRPTEYYYRFADSVGCLNRNQANESVFECLVAADTVDLQNASDYVSTSGLFGQWAFIPVTDGTLIQERPVTQLLGGGELNGVRVLSSNMENEGPDFTPRNITNEEAFREFLSVNYPFLSEGNITNIMALYSVPANASDIIVESDGVNPPYSTTNGGWASGWDQAAINLYGETTFSCPSYWLADAYAKKGRAWHLQFSVPPAQHAYDTDQLGVPADVEGTGMDEAFRTAYHHIWGNFVVRGDPTLTQAQKNTPNHENITAAGTGTWLEWQGGPGQNWMLNMNMTGGMPITTNITYNGVGIPVTSYVPGNDSSWPPLVADLKIAEGSSWEGGRGERCQLWADLGPWVQE